ncbi:TIGR03960 family B12-binding radical SAM protein [Desulfolithobacter sp.]
MQQLHHILSLVRKPGRYIGGEHNAVRPEWDGADFRFCLVFPDLYEIGMSHQGLQILYHVINHHHGFLADRCYAPDVDMEEQLRSNGVELFSVECRRPLNEFDVLGITLPYELCYTNILTILDLAGLPLRSVDRDERYPLVLGGGSCSLNPEPVAEFFDAIVLGDGEEIILEIGTVLRQSREQSASRQEQLETLAGIPGVYVPSFFKPRYQRQTLCGIEPLRSGYERVRRRVLPRLTGPGEQGRPLVPLVKPVHDRLGVEIARGCTRGCRFCQAGIIYRPVRERTMDEVLAIAEQGIEVSGFDELALLSLSSGDYSCLPQLLTRLMDRFASSHVSVSMPSMRVGTLTPGIMDQIRRVRKTGFTVAPEAGTDRLREVINKGITEKDLLATCRDAFSLGWNLIKFYFMIGLPAETSEDVEAIVDLAKRARQEAGRGSRRIQINVSVATFVPKPHTPFQWHQQISLDESREKIDLLKQLLPRKGFKLKWHDPHQSVMEGVFSRGDRRLSRLIEAAWRRGTRLDGWSEHYSLDEWRAAAAEIGLELEWYLRRRELDEILPWDHLDSGVARSFLEQEWHRALTREYTPDCRNHGCQKCGLCDFKTIYPVVHGRKNEVKSSDGPLKKEDAVQVVGRGSRHNRKRSGSERIFTYRVHYERCGDSRYLGHLEILQLVFRVLKRARLPVLFSQGYNPSPRVSFSPALPVGVESLVEYFDMDLGEPLADLDLVRERLNRELPHFIRVHRLEPVARKKKQSDLRVTYEIRPASSFPPETMKRLEGFLARDSFPVERLRKGRKKTFDLRPLVLGLEVQDDMLMLEMLNPHGRAGAGPREILEKVLGFSAREALLADIRKVGATAMTERT